MDTLTYETLKTKEGLTSLTYTSYEALKGYVIQGEDLCILHGYNNELKLHEVYYHTSSLECLLPLLNSVKTSHLLPFARLEWLEELEALGYEVYTYYKEYRTKTIKSYDVSINFAVAEDQKALSELTKTCLYISRGFTGQSATWFSLWMAGNHSSLKHAHVSDVLVEKTDGIIQGMVCVAVYNDTLWIREIAVHADLHNQGIGNKLMAQAMTYGEKFHAKQAFLMADIHNLPGHKLYKNYGFIESEEGQLDLYKKVQEISLEHYLNKQVLVQVDRKMHSKHPKYSDMIYPINYGFIPNTISGDGDAVDAYIIGPKTPVDYFEGNVIAVIQRSDDTEEKLVVADQQYTLEEIKKAVHFTEQYFDSRILI